MTQFMGYRRPDGGVGVRNHLIVLAPIDCSYEPAKKIAAQVEGAIAVTQYHGCGKDPVLVHNLVGTGLNPNVAAILVIGLGCETLTVDTIAEGIKPSGKPVETLIIQQEGGTLKTQEKAVRILQRWSQEVAQLKPEPFPLSELTLAVECGGSDATSGLAANPAVGVACDRLIDEGGTVIFSEPQEMIGTQHILARRAVNKRVASDIYKMIDQDEERLKAIGVDSRWMSAGNIDGGLTTIEEKSLGAIRKGGTRPIQGVLQNNWDRFDRPDRQGLWLQDGTGWDVPSVTHMVAAGAQIVCFTSGQGSTTGHAIAPVIKITGNPMTYQQMEDNMDINASTILDGSESLNSVGQRIYESIIDTANGKKTKAEALGYRDYIVFCRSRAAEHMLGHC
ncbi:MAG: UxaA family hydrolase [Candidatus Bathyarchaeota archaeon]|nr:UxaA family hydrolase [Candidatus Bathyarchaeota archaeon]